MPDNKNKPGPQDASRINLNEPYEVKYWCAAFHITREKLKEIVSEVGNSVRAIRGYLGK